MATSPAMYKAMLHEFEMREKHLDEPFVPVARSEQGSDIGTALYHGGVRIEDHAGLHPGLYHRGLLTSSIALGVAVRGFTPATAIAGVQGRFRVITPVGDLT